MCISSPKAPPLPPPPPPDPSIARREGEIKKEKSLAQEKSIRRRKDMVYGTTGKRSLITSSGAGYLGIGQSPTLGA